jgi:hypothetical protein
MDPQETESHHSTMVPIVPYHGLAFIGYVFCSIFKKIEFKWWNLTLHQPNCPLTNFFQKLPNADCCLWMVDVRPNIFSHTLMNRGKINMNKNYLLILSSSLHEIV